MFYEEIRIKKKPFLYIILLRLSIFTATNLFERQPLLGTNAVDVTRV